MLAFLFIVFIVFFGWWLPAALFYGLGAVLLLRGKRQPVAAVVWLLLFAACLEHTLHDSIFLRSLFNERAGQFSTLRTYAKPPDDVRTLQLHAIPPDHGPLTDRADLCGSICAKLLLGLRFDTVVLSDDRLSQYRAYSIVKEPGCRIQSQDPAYPDFVPLAKTGICLSEKRSKSFEMFEGPRFEIITEQRDDPYSPPWPIRVTYIQLSDGNTRTPIARVESATYRFAWPLPIPGVFYSGTRYGWVPDLDTLRIGFLSAAELSYGPSVQNKRGISLASDPVSVLDQVFGIALDGATPLPPRGS
jgi:hypothetical protein